jgi:hypothetical protein
LHPALLNSKTSNTSIATGIHTGRPIAIRSSASSSVALIDLKPSQKYYLRMKSHPSTEPTVAFGPGWRPYTDVVVCTTTASPLGAPTNVLRHGNASASEVTFSWTDAVHTGTEYEIGVAEMELQDAESGPLPLQHSRWAFKRIAATATGEAVFSTTISGLRDGMAHWVVVRGASGATSDPVRFDTWKNGTLYSGVHRISEVLVSSVHYVPCTMHHTPCAMHPTHCMHHASYSLYAPCILLTVCTIHPTHCMHHASHTLLCSTR